MNRVAIYFFYDEKGSVRKNTLFFLAELRKVVTYLFVVVNGDIEENGRNEIEKIADHILIRENEGFDVWAYRDALEYIGFESFNTIDELLLTNSTSFGPIFPFSEVFRKMDNRPCDFWGLSKHPEQTSYLLPNKRGYINEHIMFYFVLIRKNMLVSEAFKQYWYNIPFINSKQESVGLHEVVFTKYFTDLGFTAESYVNLMDYEGRCENSSIVLANEQVRKSRNPLVKKRAFIFPNYDAIVDVSSSWQTIDLLRFIREETNYDEALIWEEILQRYKLSVFRRNMHLSQILHKNQSNKEIRFKLGISVYIPCPQLVEIYLSYLGALPQDNIHVRIYYTDIDNKECLEEYQETHTNSKIFLMDEPTEAISTVILLDSRELIESTDFFCIICRPIRHKSRLWVTEEDSVRLALNAVLSLAHFNEITNLFRTQPLLGMVNTVPPKFGPNYSASFELLHRTRKDNYLSIHEKLQLNIPFDDLEKEIYPCTYWIRTSIASKMIDHINETNAAKLLSQEYCAAEFFFPRIVQELGAYPVSVISSDDAVVNLDVQRFNTHQIYEMLQRKIKMGVFTCMGAAQRIARIGMINPSRDSIIYRSFSLKEVIDINYRYIKEKVKSVLRGTVVARFLRKIKPVLPVARIKSAKHAMVCNIAKENGHLLYFMTSSEIDLTTTHFSLGKQNFYPLNVGSDLQRNIINYHKTTNRSAVFFKVPFSSVINTRGDLLCEDLIPVQLQWVGRASFNALELRDSKIYFRIIDDSIFCETKSRLTASVLKDRRYSFRDKLIFIFCLLNPFHPLTLFSENYGANDNAYQLYRYALGRTKRIFYVCSYEMMSAQKDPRIKKRMLSYNGRRHILAMLFAKRWITSFSLRVECWPTTNVLKDIHYAMLPAEWIFIPHGITLQDKIAYMCIRYNWENPSRTFVCSIFEKNAFEKTMGFKSVCCLGAPRMDKWFGQRVDEDDILLFFTWRLNLSSRTSFHERDFRSLLSNDYFKSIYDCIVSINNSFPNKRIHYVFHHEIVKNKLDKAIQQMLDGIPVDYIYLNSFEGTQQFTYFFSRAKYLVTDVSSVAYDFAYKEDGISIYFQPPGFVGGHYDIDEQLFGKIHIGGVAKDTQELVTLLQLKEKTEEMISRRYDFFTWLDDKNCERVYNEVFKVRRPKNNSVKTNIKSKSESMSVESIKRLGIYFFFDKDGVVDSYVFNFLNELKKVCTEVCVVVNGFIKSENEQKLRLHCNRLIIRDNVGFDSGAYKEALESYGYLNIQNQFEELILCNYTFYGPMFPLDEMMNKMSERECDFWGHCRHSGSNGKMGNRRVNSHLMSYFLVFKNQILKSPTFENYWNTLRCARNYFEAVWFHEMRCTQYFEKFGFVSESYIPLVDKFCGINSTVYFAYTQLTKFRSPLLKRKTFFLDNGRFQFGMKENRHPYEILRYIRKKTNYDPSFILENIIRTQPIHSETEKGESIDKNTNYNYVELLEAAGIKGKRL